MNDWILPKVPATLLLTATLLSTSMVQGQYNTEKPVRHIDAQTPRRSSPVSAVGQVRNVFFSEDFSGGGIPAGWTNVDDLTPVNATPVLFQWSNNPAAVAVAAVSYPDLVGSFGAPGATNGYLWANSDRGLASAPATDHMTRLTTSAIDCSGQTSVMLSMQSAIGVFDNNASEFVKVRVSTDLVTWADFYPFPCLETGNPAPPCARFSYNPEFVTVDITSAAANEPVIYIQFEWQGGWEYWWGIDDVQLSPLPDNEIRLNAAFNSTGNGEEYGRIPSAQLPSTMNVGAEVINFGQSEQTNVVLNVAFEDASGTPIPGFSGSYTVGSIPSASSVIVSESIDIPTGLSNGLYTSRFTLESDQIALDNDLSNNALSRNFEVTTDLYSLDALGNHPSGTEQALQYGTATFADNVTMNYMTMYLINSPMTVTGITVDLGSLTVPSEDTEIEAFLLDTADVLSTPSNITIRVDGAASVPRSVTQADVDAGTIGLPLDHPVVLSPGGYYAVVRVTGLGTPTTENPNDGEIYILDDATVPQPTLASAIYIPFDYDNETGNEGPHLYTNGEAYSIRITSLPSVGISNAAPLSGTTVFPNPTNGTFQIRSTSNEVLFVEITDVTGKIIRTATFSALATVDLSDVASGVYNVIVSNQTERAVHRVTVK